MKYEVAIIESEKGWGQKIDEVKEFENKEDADKFIEEYNKDNNEAEVPNWYMYARRFNHTIQEIPYPFRVAG